MAFIRRLLLIVLFAGAVSGGILYFSHRLPCEAPITYRLGAFDTRFGISKADFLADAAEAVQIWDRAAGKELFAYDPRGDMPINLVYDTRQATVDTNKTLTASVDSTKASADALNQRILLMKARYAEAQSAYESALARFQSDLRAYNDRIDYWNARGGAPDAEYAALEAQKSSLESERADAESKAEQASDIAREANALIDQYNALAETANVAVAKINQSADREFEQGEYVVDSTGKHIDVYEFDTKTKLVRLLAHELGHALGIEHNSDPRSIMYYLNTYDDLTLSASDIASLKAVCGLK